MKTKTSMRTKFSLAALGAIAPLAAPAALSAQTLTATGLSVGALTFGAPWVLLPAIPVVILLWRYMRNTPPKPKEHKFPAIRLLFGLESKDQQPVRMPLWHRLLRTTAVALVFLGFARPQFNPEPPLEGQGPVIVVVDNDWAAARNWEDRQVQINAIIDRAGAQDRPVIVLPTAAPADGGPVQSSGPVSAAEARRLVEDMKPQPWSADRSAALAALESLEADNSATVLWLSNGLNDDYAAALAQRLDDLGTLTVLEDGAGNLPRLLALPSQSAETLNILVRRPPEGKSDLLSLSALDESGHTLQQVQTKLESGQTSATVTFNLPPDMQKQVARISIDGEKSAGATLLLDGRWRRRPVGLADAGTGSEAQPLLNEYHYIEKALEPYAELHHGDVDSVLRNDLAVLVMTDGVALDAAGREKLQSWVQNGGTLLRFAGPRLGAQEDSGNDSLLPVPLRGERRMDSGSLSESAPARLAPFEQNSPFYGLSLPGNVTVSREVLAQPSPQLDQYTWARLDDGTPLVTARREGQGWVVLVHTTAHPEWSNLALSGLFVDMLRAVVTHSQGVAGGNNLSPGQTLPPIRVMDGLGALKTPGPAVRGLSGDAATQGLITPQNPPGYYGDENARRAYNLYGAVPTLESLPEMAPEITRKIYEKTGHKDLYGPLVAVSLALLLADALLMLGQGGAFRRKENAAKISKAKPSTPAPV